MLIYGSKYRQAPPLVTSEKELRLARPPLPSMYHCLNLAWPLPLSHACSLRPLPAPNYIQLCIYLHSLSSFSLSLSFSDQLCNFQWPPAAQCGLEDQCVRGFSINACVHLEKTMECSQIAPGHLPKANKTYYNYAKKNNEKKKKIKIKWELGDILYNIN